jgi:alanine racemase
MHQFDIKAYIDLDALIHNVELIRKQVAPSKVLAMVKANAYGHGLASISRALQDHADAFGVANMYEALRLYNAGLSKKPIILLKGFYSPEELQTIDQCNFETVIHNYEQLEILEKAQLQNPLKVWLKLDTGMHRLGFLPAQISKVYARLMNNKMVSKPLTLMSHFSEADEPHKSKTQEQLDLFNKIVHELKFTGPTSIANSAGLMTQKNAHKNFVRAGISMYGASPFPDKRISDLGFKPIMTMKTKIIATKELAKGDTIGYGSTWTCPEKMPIAIINAGYGDGYPRHIQSGAPVLINGVRCGIVGRVAMDMINVDLRPVPKAKVGDEVILWGDALPIEEVAQVASTVPYEIFCQLTQRVKFVFHGGTEK